VGPQYCLQNLRFLDFAVSWLLIIEERDTKYKSFSLFLKCESQVPHYCYMMIIRTMFIHIIVLWDRYAAPGMCRPALKCATSPFFERLEEQLCTVAGRPIVPHHRSTSICSCASRSRSWFMDSFMGHQFWLAATLVYFRRAAISAICLHRLRRDCVNAGRTGATSFS
jgi:hypothetical protein